MAKRDFTISAEETDDPGFREWVGGVLDHAQQLAADVPSTDDSTKVYTKGPRREFLAEAGLVAPPLAEAVECRRHRRPAGDHRRGVRQA